MKYKYETKYVDSVEAFLVAVAKGYCVIRIPARFNVALVEALRKEKAKSPEYLFAYASCLNGLLPTLFRKKDAFEICDKLAQQDFVKGYLGLGYCYLNAVGVEKNEDMAAKWFKKAANQGDAIAMHFLGMMAHEKRDYEQAIPWYKSAVALGHGGAVISLSLCYQDGKGVPCDPKQSFELVQELANKGDDAGEYWLGIKYKRGDGVEASRNHAIYWLLRSAAKGNKHAADQLHNSFSPDTVLSRVKIKKPEDA